MPASDTREAVATLRDRVKHGQNMTKILESQLDTAQQNISLLQGQVRLANETILNLKKYFAETESTLNELLPDHSSSRVFHFDAEPLPQQQQQQQQKDENELSQKHGNVDSTTRSPIPTDTSNSSSGTSGESHKHEDKRDNHNKSPYAQQLRQVLDVLQDEEPRKPSNTQYHHHHDVPQHKECACSDCQTPTNYASRSKNYHETDYLNKRSGDEHIQSKQQGYGHSRETNNSPKSPFLHKTNETIHGHHSYSSHCTGPCCVNNGYKMEKPSPVSYYTENDKQQQHHQQHHQQQHPQHRQQHNHHHHQQQQQQQQKHQQKQQQHQPKHQQHYLDKSPPSTMHYGLEMHSPDLPVEATNRRSSEVHHGHHCSEKCSCRSSPVPSSAGYVSYVPYGYHLVENQHRDGVQPMSPSARRKRGYVPLMPNEEPPHLKYTKVKRIDGSKLTAQKVLQGGYFNAIMFAQKECNM